MDVCLCVCVCWGGERMIETPNTEVVCFTPESCLSSLFSEVTALGCRLFFVCHVLINFCFTFLKLVFVSLSLGTEK